MMQKCILNGNKFHQAKVIKVIHEEFTSLLICNDGVTVKATVVLDATGFSRSLVQYDKPYNPGYRVASGILAKVLGGVSVIGQQKTVEVELSFATSRIWGNRGVGKENLANISVSNY
ncbi:hypothetical protein HHK36_019602 [Tetracentron sinense]|uniref:Uncharacterized protein n=1 Tax=Tetracentron sinense TaxID=13715 RepID=A0A834YWP0_TETSI|nr:hypothetical protein HHK36_019602 [Tetracentron sinense]